MTIHHPSPPHLSIIIPTLNRAALLRKTLLSIIEQQNAAVVYEVIVVDNGSVDDTSVVCAELSSRIPHFVYQYNNEPGLLTGRHSGTVRAKGQIISFIDDDVELNPGWINALSRIFDRNPDVAIVGGPSLPKYHAYPPSWVKYFWQPAPHGGSMCLPLSLIDIGCTQLEIDPLYIFGLNYSIRKAVLFELGGFHPDCLPAHLQQYQGDGETGLSIKAAGKKVKALFAAAAFVYHQVAAERITPAYFEKWHYYNGVCSSFTNIRRRHHLYPAPAPVRAGNSQLIRQVKNAPAWIRRSLAGKAARNKPDEIISLQACFNESYRKGYAFHQRAFDTDAAVKTWVLKPDYWNYTLPS